MKIWRSIPQRINSVTVAAQPSKAKSTKYQIFAQHQLFTFLLKILGHKYTQFVSPLIQVRELVSLQQ